MDPKGIEEVEKITHRYMRNATILKRAMEQLGYRCYGGEHAPYIWVDLNGEKSWNVFDQLLEGAQVVTTPGVGFGEAGEGFLRLSAFGKHEDVEEAVQRISALVTVN